MKKKILGVVFALVLLSLSLVTAVPVAATTLTVDTSLPNTPPNYHTIQAAVDAADPGDTILVVAGTYEENIVIPNTMRGGLQLRGAGKTSSIISITSGTAIAVGTGKVNRLMPGVTIRGFGFNGNNTARNAIEVRARGNSEAPGVIADNRFENFQQAIEASNEGPHDYWDIENNEFYRNRVAITAVGSYYEISGNLFENYKEGIRFEEHYFTIEDNQFLGGIDVPDPEPTDETDQVAILFFSCSHDVSVTGNEIIDTTTGVWVKHDARPDLSNVAVEFNNMAGNTNGVVVQDAQVLDAEYNWWGHASGPGGAASGLGDSVSVNVDYSPSLPGTWQTYYDGTEKDTDGDGFSDLEEYWLGTDPGDDTDFPGAAIEEVANTYAPAGETTETNTTNASVSAAASESASVNLAEYGDTPIEDELVFDAVGKYIDVHTETPGNLEEVVIGINYDDSGMTEVQELSLRISYWNSEVDDWRQCSDQGVDTSEDYIWAEIRDDTTPVLSYLTGGPFGAGPASVELDSEWYKTGDTVEVTVEDMDANPDPIRINEAEGTATSDTDTFGITVVLTETDVNTAIFEGTFPLVSPTPAPGPDELGVDDGDTITVVYLAAGYTATVDDICPEIAPIVTVPEAVAGIVYDGRPIISAVLSDVGSGIDTDEVVMRINGVPVTPTELTESLVEYQPSELEAFPAGSTVEVTVDAKDNVGNSVDMSLTFTTASPFNVTVDETEIDAATGTHVTVTFMDLNGDGADGALIDDVTVTLSGAGVSETQTIDNADSCTFVNVTPEQAGTITVTVEGTFDDPQTPVATEVRYISVTGYLVEGIPRADASLDTTEDIALTVTTKAGVAVNTGIVTITAKEVDGFMKDVDDDGELESFGTIVINGTTGEITYDGASAEDCLVNDGYYEVTGITFANIGVVTVAVADGGGGPQASFDTAFTVGGAKNYTLDFEPATLTAGVDLDELAIAVTDAGDPVTDVKWITIGTGEAVDVSSQAPEDGVYTVDPDLVSGEATLSVMAENEAGTRCGTRDLEVELPTLSYVVTEGTDVRDLMLTGEGYDYTIAVTALNAQEEPLDGLVWLGIYNPATETFTELVAEIAELPLDLDADGQGKLGITQEAEDLLPAGLLVFKLAGPAIAVGNAALLSTPSIRVEAPVYTLSWTPEAPIVGEEITFTVTDNHGNAAGNRDVRVVSPAGDLIEKVTIPAGVFKYTPTEAGDYAVYVWGVVPGVEDWQAPEIVTVAEILLVSIAASPSEVSLNVDGTQELTITATYTDGTDAEVTADATYTSDNETVATVSQTGVITAVAEGEATVTVTYETETADVPVTVSEVLPVIWSCPVDHAALIAPNPAAGRPFLSTAVDLSEVTCDADWFTVLWLDESTGDWFSFYSGFEEANDLLTLEPGQYYYVIVPTPGELTIPQ